MLLRDLGFYLTHGVVNTQAAERLVAGMNPLIKEFAKSTKDVIECMNVPTHALHTPIVGDYIKYNEQPHYGEVVNAKL